MDTRGDGHLISTVVTGLIYHEQDLLGRARPHVASEVRECQAEERGVDARQEQPCGLAPLGMDEGVARGPGVPVVRRCDGALPPGSPDPAQDWREAGEIPLGGRNPSDGDRSERVFILSPPLDSGVGGRLPQRPQAACQVFVNAAWAA